MVELSAACWHVGDVAYKLVASELRITRQGGNPVGRSLY